jgi:hypothetical protein
MRIGIAHHFGWAVAVAASDDHRVADRRRIELVEPGTPVAPVHHDGAGLDDAALAEMLAVVRASAARAPARALDAIAAALDEPVVSLSLRAGPADFPTDLATVRRAPYESRADSVMYLQVLHAAARDRGWAVHLFDAKDAQPRAAALLGDRAHDVLHGPRATLGPPWTNDHRLALAATVLAAHQRDAGELRA